MTPKVTVTDSVGGTYTETTVVNIITRDELDVMLKAKWNGMKGRLALYDIEGALDYFSYGSKEEYRQIFNLLPQDLPSLVSNMQGIELVYSRGDAAKYRIRREQVINGVLQTITYYIYMSRDENGIWKIASY